MDELIRAVEKAFHEGTYFCVVSNPKRKDEKYRKIELHFLEGKYLVEKYTIDKVFHSNLAPAEAKPYIIQLLTGAYRALNAWDGENEHTVRISKKGKVLSSQSRRTGDAPKPREAHNRKKSSLLPEGVYIAPLYDMGIYDRDGHVITGMYDKYRQINRFIEIIDDSLKYYNKRDLSIIDYGCGKSYLSFVLYFYLKEVRGYNLRMVGLDLKKDVILKCGDTARKYGYDTLTFEAGDIGTHSHTGPLDIVISLHACDTATDAALFNAIKWNAELIFAAPCCQRELNAQINADRFAILTRYGVVKERFCALATDTIRANLLECCGYRTQLLEFIDMGHTPKNIIIRAVRKKGSSGAGALREETALREITAFMGEFSFNQTLYRKLIENKYIH